MRIYLLFGKRPGLLFPGFVFPGDRLKRSLLTGCLLAACALTGCVNQPGPGFESGDWRLLGKVAITTENESRILGIDWRQSGDRSVIDLSGPLGISVAQVEVLGDRLTITTSKGVSHQSNDLSMVLNQDVPVSLPWRELRSWVRGMTVGGELIGPDGHDSGAWQVRVVKKDESGPRLILFNHRLATLRLHIRDWR